MTYVRSTFRHRETVAVQRTLKLRLWPVAIVLLGCVYSVSLAQAPSAQMKSRLNTAITDSIRLLEAKKYEIFVERYLSPSDSRLKRIRERQGGLSQFISEFGSQRAARLLDALRTLDKRKVTFDSSGRWATYAIPASFGSGGNCISFVTDKTRWFLSDICFSELHFEPDKPVAEKKRKPVWSEWKKCGTIRTLGLIDYSIKIEKNVNNEGTFYYYWVKFRNRNNHQVMVSFDMKLRNNGKIVNDGASRYIPRNHTEDDRQSQPLFFRGNALLGLQCTARRI